MGAVIRIDQALAQTHLCEAVRSTVRDTLNALLEAEADKLGDAKRYEHSAERVDTRAGHSDRQFQTQACEVTLKMPKLRILPFETKVLQIVAKLHEMKLPAAAALVQDYSEETFNYFAFPNEYWRSLRTNNSLERIMREIRRRTRVVGAFPEGNSALLLVSARLRYIAGNNWGAKRYLDMNRRRDLTPTVAEPSTA